MTTTAFPAPVTAASGAPASSVALPSISLRGRRQAVRRRRLVLRMRDWLGVAVIAGFALTLFAVTFFSLLGR